MIITRPSSGASASPCNCATRPSARRKRRPGTAAEGHDALAPVGAGAAQQLERRLLFCLSERRLPVLDEHLGYRPAGPLLDQLVDVAGFAAERVSETSRSSRLAGAHEADADDRR